MFYLVDWYEDPSTPDIIGQYETKKETKQAWIKYVEDTDGECNLQIMTETEYDKIKRDC